MDLMNHQKLDSDHDLLHALETQPNSSSIVLVLSETHELGEEP